MRRKVLVVEDNLFLAENFSRILRSEFEVATSESADLAIKIIDEFKPDIILLDILLDGYSGFSLLNEINSHYDIMNISVVICSDLTDGLDADSLEKYGVRAILDKSKATPADILRTIKEVE